MCPLNVNMTSPTNCNGPRKTAASEHRRCNKPIMEKKRRARINNCLNELKNLILDALKKDPARHSKLEKADILEMTVKHLEALQRQQMAMTVAADPAVVNKYRAGFSECATEVGRFLGRGDAPPLDPHVKRRLMSHLTNCLNNGPEITEAEARTIHVQIPSSPGGHMMQLVPTCLPSGDIAFVLPQPSSSQQPQSQQQQQQQQAVAVRNISSCESAESLAARTAVVAPLAMALDLSVGAMEAPAAKTCENKVKPTATVSPCTIAADVAAPAPVSSALSQESSKGAACGRRQEVEEADMWRPW